MDKKRILIVEDEPEMLDMIKTRLESNNYEVLTAYNGPEGLEKAKKEKPDLVILDLMLPQMDGYKVCGMLKFDRKYKNIPVILFTARAAAKDIVMGKEVCADAYIMKPFEPETLLSKIQELLEE